ncbi:uncharacterized protein LOC132932934 [Metopolophium dirhodum]|uniref:uncharacterized protein LOC132932934 n=1 Tax=Metopolophium dirhodum TaxID=44670 RepID=UPI00298FB6E2|nr:uncharacterized protein LOC132932934 [Metopolophium dirhodum]
MLDYESLGHMTLAEGPGQYFIPHHAIQKSEGDSVKLRVVFDASAKCHSGVSLNQCLLVGPKLQQDIVDVLIGFRVHKVAFTTDICKINRQIEVLPQYRGYQYILWREYPQASLKEYTLNTVTYGVNKSLEAAKTLQLNLINTLARSGLELKKWASNTPELLEHLRPEDCSRNPLAFEQNDATHVVLGMRWSHDQDYFSFGINSFKMNPTKRGVLSMIARIFDPLGLLAPATFYAKSIMQRVWVAQISWDDQLPSDIAEDWCDFYHSLG